MSDDGPSRRPASHVDASVERPRIWVTVDIWSEDSGPKRAAPESAIGGPLCLVRDGDVIALDVPGRSLTLDVPDEELTRRRAAWQAPAPTFERGYRRLYQRHVLRGHQGCDFDFPRLPSGATPGS